MPKKMGYGSNSRATKKRSVGSSRVTKTRSVAGNTRTTTVTRARTRKK